MYVEMSDYFRIILEVSLTGFTGLDYFDRIILEVSRVCFCCFLR